MASGVTAWVGGPYSVSMSSHINGTAGGSGQSVTGSTVLPLSHDTPCTISVSVNTLGDEVLTMGAYSLTTSYKLTGIASGDAGWVDSTTFLTHTYAVPGSNITDNVTLSVKGTAPANTAPEAGTYSATIILTATF
jgi:hypothetical protein